MKKLTIIFIIFMQSTTASSMYLIKDYLSQKDTHKAFFEAYIDGLGEGMMWSIVSSKDPFYCPPGNLAVTKENYIRILEDQIRREGIDNLPIELTLKNGLQHTFPCAKK